MRDRQFLYKDPFKKLSECSNFRRHSVFVGGFPCQDISPAGHGDGIDGEKSGIWRNFLRQIERHKPGWVVIENHPALRHRGIEKILMAFAEIGYDSEWHVISANDIGAPHIRERLWIISYSNEINGKERIRFRENLKQKIQRCREENMRTIWLESNRPPPRMAHGVSRGLDAASRIAAVGNSIVVQIAEMIALSIKEAMSSLN